MLRCREESVFVSSLKWLAEYDAELSTGAADSNIAHAADFIQGIDGCDAMTGEVSQPRGKG